MDITLSEKLMTAEEFSIWAEAQPEKHRELFDGVPQLLQSQNWGHARHILQVVRAFDKAIEASNLNLSLATQGLVVKAGPRTAFEPDIVIFAGQMADHDIIAPDPAIVVEVLSPSTARKDLTVKLAGYFSVPVLHYLIADWEEQEIVHYGREGTGIARPVILKEGVLRLNPPGIEVSLADVFK